MNGKLHWPLVAILITLLVLTSIKSEGSHDYDYQV